MIAIEPIRHDPLSLQRYCQLFTDTFPRSSSFSVDYLDWLYNSNPDGAAFGFDAWDSGEIVAHYACIPTQVQINNASTKAMLSLNTATRPSHQGRGLFLLLASMTYEAAAEQGFQAVYGVANAHSTPGFTRKLGFQLVSPLDARVGLGSLEIDWDVVERCASFQRLWTESRIHWRLSNPNNRVRVAHGQGCTKYFARSTLPFLNAYAEAPTTQSVFNPAVAHVDSPLRLYIGNLPAGSSKFRRYVNIPKALRPSPLNFIYRALSQAPEKLDSNGLCISFLDFDAF
jgi:GNAT superfamily N-acetyltransferase